MTTFTLAHRPLTRLLSGLLFCLFLFGQTERATAQGQSFPCVLKCRDTTICFNLPDSMVQLLPPAYAPAGPVIGNGPDCQFDSIWSNAPGVYPVGTTVVTWYVWAPPGRLDSCTMNVVRNPPSSYTISFTTSPPIVGGVINICNGQSITFNDNSTGISGLLWNFGNGYYSSNATHTEPAWHYPPGTYYDTLTVYDDCGSPHDTAFMVVVDSASGPDITCISVQCPGDTVTYHTSAVCTNYTWAVTGGTFLTPPPPTSDSCTVIWGNGPSGTISLSVNGCTPPLNCPNPTIKTVSIVPATLPIAGDTIVCSGSTSTYCVECIPGNIHNWELMPANAGTISGQGTCCLTIQWAPGFAGTVTLTLNYQNILTGSGCNLPGNCRDDHNCGGTASITIHVKPIFGISGPATVCPNVTSSPFNGMNLTTNTIEPATSWKVQTPVPSILNFATTAAFNAYTWNAGPGSYYVTAYAPAGVYCNDSAFKAVTVLDMIAPAAISGPDTVCPGVSYLYSTVPNMNGVTYNWTVTNGTIIGPANGNSVMIQWNAGGGSVNVSQTLTNPPGCTSPASATFSVYVWPPFSLPTITPSVPIACVKSTIVYSIPPSLISNGTYTWSVVPSTAGNILSANGTNQITIRWIDASNGPIFVKLKIERCYADSVMFPVNLLGLPPVPNIVAPATVCKNSLVNFSTSSPGPVWNWNFGDAGTANTQNASHTYVTAGNFNVFLAVTNANGCSDTAFTTIQVDDIPQLPVITGPASVCSGSTVTYTFTQPVFPGANYVWTVTAPGVLQAGQGTNTITVKWNSPGSGTVSLAVQSSCPPGPVTPMNVVVNALPTASIGIPSPLCIGAPLTFTGAGGVTYNWSFPGAGNVNLTNQSVPVVTYNATGNFGSSLSIIDANGCTANTNVTFTINPLPLVNVTANEICNFPASVTFNTINTGGYTYLWSTGATTASITQTLTGPTTYSVTVTNAFGCTNTGSKTINGGVCNSIPGVCVVNDSIDFTSVPPLCLTTTFTKIYSGNFTGWDFGDGSNAGPISPITHTFPTPGVYNVTVQGFAIGMDAMGQPCTTSIARTHPVTIPFDAAFNVTYQCNGLGQMQTIINNTSLYLNSAASYSWNWYLDGNGTPFSSVHSPANQLFSAGPHNVTLIISDPGGTLATCTLTVAVNVPVPVTAAANPPATPPFCAGTPVNFSDASFAAPTSWTWDFYNNGISLSNLQNPQFTYPAAGSFTYKLTVGDQYGCSSSTTRPITINAAGTGTITINNTFCDSIQLTASGVGPFTWSNVVSQPVPDNPFYVKQNGYYSVTGYNPSFGCPYKATVGPLTVKKSPNASISGKTQYCQGENLDLKTSTAGVTVSWNLYPSGPVLGTNPNLTIPANTAGTFTYQVTLTAANGCTATDTISVTVDPVPSSAVIVASGPLTFCEGDSVKLQVVPAAGSYLWSKSPTPPLTPPSNTNSFIWVTQSGTYSVIAQTVNGCSYPNIAPVTVTVNPLPAITITGDTIVCSGKGLSLLATQIAGATYSWVGPNFVSGANPMYQPNMQLSDAGVYTVTITSPNGCTTTRSVNVVVNPSPVAPVIQSNPGGILCEGSLFNLFVTNPAGAGHTYNWSTGQLGLSINAALVGDYWVMVTNSFGCKANSNILTIHPRPDLSCAPTGCYEFCNECDSVTIPGPAGMATYTWQIFVPNMFVYYSNSQNLTVLPPGGKFNLVATNLWGCADTTDTLNIHFEDCCPAPDLFTCLDTCENFDDNLLNDFGPDPNASNVIVSTSNVNSQGGPGDYYLFVQDQPGASGVLGSYLFDGKWCCGSFCFDFRLLNDGGVGGNVNPSVTIMSGTLGFTFTSTINANQNNGWHSVCAPITDCNPAPAGPGGAWTPVGATLPTDWTTVLSNVTEVIFPADYNAAPDEASALDNICLNSDVPDIDAGPDTTICVGSVVTLHVSGCTGTPTWSQISGDSLIPLNNGPFIDVMPLQNTCYVVTCCGYQACCCDTDTVCVNVRPLPQLQWNLPFTPVCLGSDSIYLDTANVSVFVNNNWIPLANAGGTWVFSGVNVIGNYFYPNLLGPNAVTLTYTDSAGCSASLTKYIGVIFCCPDTCEADAGPDHVVCLGQPFILQTAGCDSSKWYAISGDSLVLVGNTPSVDVFPMQNTCYVLVCYEDCCVDTDTVCLTVNPPPQIQWAFAYTPVCQFADSILLDTAQITVYINNTWVPLANAPGTWSFSGVNVVGNYFYPNQLGLNAVTFTYTDSLGCSASLTKYFSVIYCCPDTCEADAGPDHVVCLGQPFILQTAGCDSSKWYAISGDSLVLVGNTPIVDVFPMQNTCYVLVCYEDCCVDTDTVCLTVNPPPQIQWAFAYTPVCQFADSILLDTAQITVYINNTWMPLANAPGTWSFSGVNVVGNYFYPNQLGSNAVTFTYTDSLGCSASLTEYFSVIYCCPDTCEANAGPDHVVCLGQPFILQTAGCDSSKWYAISGDSMVLVGNTPIVDVFPMQNTCYVLVCYEGCCVDTDTVCLTVNPPPQIQWPFSLSPACQFSDSIYLDTALVTVYINNAWVPLANAPGTWSFSGVNVVGNYFFPNQLGSNPVVFTYTDSLGCSASITKYINVIACCLDTCDANAGPDQVICAGQPLTLQTAGCDSTTWFEIFEGELQPVGQGPIIDLFPMQSTCYVLVCSNGCCSDTDTVCVTVNPVPILQWPYFLSSICVDAGPQALSDSSILVWQGNAWIPANLAAGTGYFTGPGIFANVFTPPGIGSFLVSYTFVDTNGCSTTVTNAITVIQCGGCDTAACNCNNVPPPPPPTITIVSVDPDNCFNDGCIHATFTGCCLLFSYSYFDPCNPLLSYSIAQTPDSNIFCNLRAGNYIIYVQDACGNFTQQSVTVPLASGPLTAILNFSQCGDSVCVAVEGGCAPYTFDWGNGPTTDQCIALEERCVMRTVTITDARGCSVTKTITVPRFDFVAVQPHCCLNNGSICIEGCFGPQPYFYSWSNGATTSCIAGLGAGTYCVTVTNRDGEQFTCCYTLSDAGFVPPSVSFNFSNCGSMVTAVINGNGCGNYSYHWQNNSTEPFFEGANACDSLTFTIVGCDGSQHHYGFRVPAVLPSISPVSCATGLGSICIDLQCYRGNVTGYFWTGVPIGAGSSCVAVPPGTYTVCITNDYGDMICCNVFLPPVTGGGPLVTLSSTPVGCLGINDGTASSTVSGGSPPYTYAWSNGATTPSIAGLAAGLYTLTVTDANGCSTTLSVVVRRSFCPIDLHLDILIEGFTLSGTVAAPMGNGGSGGCLFLNGTSTNPADVDSINIALVDSASGLVGLEGVGIVQDDGSVAVSWSDSLLIGERCYIRVRHRNSLETWSAVPLTVQSVMSYDFSSSAGSAYGANLRELGNGRFALWSGDVNQDQLIEASDYTAVENAALNFVFGYVPTDLTGDLLVEATDYSIVENNMMLFLFTIQP